MTGNSGALQLQDTQHVMNLVMSDRLIASFTNLMRAEGFATNRRYPNNLEHSCAPSFCKDDALPDMVSSANLYRNAL
jgi:hypothetical protein